MIIVVLVDSVVRRLCRIDGHPADRILDLCLHAFAVRVTRMASTTTLTSMRRVLQIGHKPSPFRRMPI
jgi:hypothetical protein